MKMLNNIKFTGQFYKKYIIKANNTIHLIKLLNKVVKIQV